MDVQEMDRRREATGPPNTGHALTITGLTKRFAATVAVDTLSLTVPRGSFFGLVGPNGAGKTTALSMAVGLLRPDAGTARIFGHDVWADPIRAKGKLSHDVEASTITVFDGDEVTFFAPLDQVVYALQV